MKEKLRTLFQQKFNPIEYRKVVLENLLHAQQLLSQPQFLEETNDGDCIYGLGYLTDADGKQIGLYYTDVVNSDVRRKRVGFRQMMKSYVKYGADAAIAVFADKEHWRLSYMSDLKGGETSAKRFSYILGDLNGQYNTPVNRLLQLGTQAPRLQLKDIFEAFSVETLSDEFFDLYRDHYADIVEYLTGKRMVKVDSKWVEKVIHAPLQSVYEQLTGVENADKIVRDYVKKMMGRIVFLHFLQKKGWLNGDNNFMKHTFSRNKDCQDDFLEKILEPLFFGFLNTRKEDRAKLFDKHPNWDKILLTIWENIPYLNGGLFEQDEVDNLIIRLPRSMFDDLFKFLAEYNFTVDENDPDDAEVGVDPEMLGKIFESLLEDNKAKGAFYTPKEIVRYMCKESLIAYLSSRISESPCPAGRDLVDLINSSDSVGNDNRISSTAEGGNNLQDSQDFARSASRSIRKFVETHEMQPELEPYRDTLDIALRNVKICDPAIGSGAFPMGLLNELWRCREALAIREANNLQDLQDFVSAASRSKLKKEIIENNIYGVDIEKGAIDIARLRFWLSIVVDADKPEPLPNFDYKFMQGNSLIESYKGIDLSRISNRLRGGQSKSTQLLLGLDSDLSRKNLQRLMRDYFSVTDHNQKACMRQAINDEVKRLITYFIGGTSSDLDKLNPSANQDFFLWHTWFKDIFDNSGFDIVIGNPPYINVENLDEKTKDYLFTNYSTCQGRTDIYIGFIEKSIALMNCKGVTSFIIPYSYTNQNYGELSRKMLTEKYSINEIVDTSNYYVFDNAVVKNIIIRFGKSKGDYTLIRIADNKECFEQANFGDRILPTKTFLQLKNCRIETKPFENIMGIKENIEKASIRLGKIYLVAYGVRVNNKYDKNKPKNYYIHDTPRAQYKKFTEGKCIDRYTFTQYGWLNYCPNEHYNSMFPELFENEKLMFINVVSKGLRFAYDNEGYYNSHTVVNCVNISKLTKVTHQTAKKAIKEGYINLAKNYSTKYVLGLINSKLMNWYFLQFQSEGLHCYPDDAKQFPIAKATPEQQQPIIDLVDKILEKKRDFPNANTSVLEKKSTN